MADMQSSLLIPYTVRDPQPGDSLVLFLPVFLAIGAGLYFIVPFEPPAPFLWGSLIVSVLGAIMSIHWRDTYAWRWGAAFGILLCLGGVLAQTRTHMMHTPLLQEKMWGATVAGTVDAMERAGAGWRVVLREATVNEKPQRYQLRLSVRQRAFHPALGGQVAIKANLMPPSPPFVPGAFDFQRHAFFQGISGYGYATKIIENKPPETVKGQSRLEMYREWLAAKVYATLKQPEAGVVTALLNGQRGGISNKTTQELQQSGLQHIISISGLHVGLLATLVFFAVRFLLALNMRLALTWPIKKIAAVCALATIILYMLIVGLSPATVRSVIMTGIVLLAVLTDREAINLRLVALSAIVLLVLQPESVLDIGFQLSFAAVTGLVAFYQYTHDFWHKSFWQDLFLWRLVRIGLISVVTTIIATVATAPLVLLHFQQIPLLSMLANALATPVMTFVIMPGTFLSYLLTPFPILGEGALHMMGEGVKLVLKISSFVAHLPSAVWKAPALPVSSVLFLLCGMFLLLALKNRVRYSGIAACVIAVVPLFSNPAPDILMTQDRVVLLPEPSTDTLFVEGRIDAFQKKMLLQLTGKKQVAPWVCSTDMCDMTMSGKSIRLVRTVPALKQACDGKSDIVLTRYYLDQRCSDSVVVDRHDVEEKEGVLLWIGDTIHTRFGRTGKDRRPWEQKKAVKQVWYSPRNDIK